MLSSWWRRKSLALELLLARLLGGCRSSVARKLPSVLCGSCTGPGLSRACSLRHSLLTTGSLVLGPVFRGRSPTLHHLPMGCHGWEFVFVSMLRNVVCIISWKYWVTFLWNLSFLLRQRLIPSLPQLLASSCPGLHEEWVGVLVCVFIHQPPWLLILNGSQVSHTGPPSRLRLNLLLIPKVSILSEQMEFCFSQSTFYLILTKE